MDDFDSPLTDKSGADPPSEEPFEGPEPSGPATVRCSCGVDVSPEGMARGSCNSCGRFLPGNELALKHGLRREMTREQDRRRDAIADELFVERGGCDAVDVLTRHYILEFATLSVQFEDANSYLSEFGTRTAVGRERAAARQARDIAARRARVGALLASTSPTPRTPTVQPGFDTLSPDELIARAQATAIRVLQMVDLLRRAAEPSEQMADLLRRAIDPNTDHAPPTDEPIERDDVGPMAKAIEPDAAPEPAPEPEPVCPYCHRKCVGVEHQAYSTLHWKDPIEVKKRDERATKEMNVRRPSPWRHLDERDTPSDTCPVQFDYD